MPIEINKSDIANCIIKPISGLETIPIRHAVLRKGKPIDACAIAQDNLDSTYHFGIFLNSKLVGVSTFVLDQSPLFNDPIQYRLRAMGVLEDYQGLHLGKQLLQHGVTFLKSKNIDRLWFNARTVALHFYKNNGFETIGAQFNIPEVGPHYVMHKILK